MTPQEEDCYFSDEEIDCWTCQRCQGDGTIIVCMDDLCRAAGECFYRRGACDGIAICPECKGIGLVEGQNP